MTKPTHDKDIAGRLQAMDDATERLFSLLPKAGDPLIVLLKGHLLIEEQLYLILSTWIPDAVYVEKARLSFNQKLQLARGIVGVLTDDDSLWSAIHELNAIRNRLAHHAEPEEIHELTSDFLKICESHKLFKKHFRDPIFPGATKLHNALIWLFRTLNTLATAADVVRDHSPMPKKNSTSRSNGRAAKRRALGPCRRSAEGI